MPIEPLRVPVDETSLPSVQMWREDFERIAAIVRNTYPGSELVVVTELHRLDSFDEISQLPYRQMHSLSIATSDGRITLNFRQAGCLLTVKRPDTLSRGLAAEIRDFIDLRRRRLGRVVLGLVLSALGAVCIVMAARSGELDAQEPGPAVGWWLAAGSAALLGTFVAFMAPPRNRLFTQYRAEAPTFLMRKRDDLLIESSVALVSLVIGGVLGYWINTIT